MRVDFGAEMAAQLAQGRRFGARSPMPQKRVVLMGGKFLIVRGFVRHGRQCGMAKGLCGKYERGGRDRLVVLGPEVPGLAN